jgi:hypothetical protein
MAMDILPHRGGLIDRIIFRPSLLEKPPGTRLGLSWSRHAHIAEAWTRRDRRRRSLELWVVVRQSRLGRDSELLHCRIDVAVYLPCPFGVF